MKERPTTTIHTYFATLDDPRVERTKAHQLLDIVTIALCGVICGADTWVDIEEFGKAKYDESANKRWVNSPRVTTPPAAASIAPTRH